MRASRLLSILLTVQARGRVTAQALADQLEVSRRTIYRDIDELSAAGVPIYADPGPGGGFALLDGFRTDLNGLTTEEAAALPFAGLPSVAADLGLAVSAASAHVKFMAALPHAARADVGRIADRFHLDALDWQRRSRASPHLLAIAAAVWQSHVLRIRYESWRSTRWRTVEPLGLVLKAGQWYLIASAEKGVAIFRVTSVRNVEQTDGRFDRPSSFDLKACWKDLVNRFEAGLRRRCATLRAAPTSLDRLDRLGADIADKLREAVPGDAGWREAVVPIETIGHAASLILGFADEIEVIAPVELMTELATRAARVATLYAQPRVEPVPDPSLGHCPPFHLGGRISLRRDDDDAE